MPGTPSDGISSLSLATGLDVMGGEVGLGVQFKDKNKRTRSTIKRRFDQYEYTFNSLDTERRLDSKRETLQKDLNDKEQVQLNCTTSILILICKSQLR